MTTEDHDADEHDLDAVARDVLRHNDRGGYTVPTAGLYPFQWNWDSAFAAWGWSTFDVDRAWTEIETLLTGQWETGMVPHIVFHRPDDGYFPGPDVWRVDHAPPTSGISQPPVLASMARRVLDADPEGGLPRLAALYPRLVASHRWWHDVRCTHGVAAIIHPWESGRDNSPAWDVGLADVDVSGVEPYERRDLDHVDASMRPSALDYDRYVAIVQYGRSVGWDHDRIVADGPFLMADPALHLILLRAHRDLAELGRLLGDAATAAELDRWADDLQAGLTRLWNDDLGAHDALDLRTGRFAGCATASAWLEYWAGVADDRIDARLRAVWDRVAFGIPTHDPAAPGFEPRRYWRGPVWPVVNSLIGVGLAEEGRTAEAELLQRETAALIERNGLSEYFDPIDGTPCGGDRFTWTAAVWLAWVRAGGSTVLA
ncbi:MAG: MGH1-like glycoside hydrolase domain-containing protein [Acidimicrobiia bacterium]